MRRAAKRDANEPLIVDYLEAAGCSVLKVNEAGKPDLVAFKSGRVWLIEIKQPKGKLRERQTAFQAKWTGPPIHVVRTVDEAAKLLANG